MTTDDHRRPLMTMLSWLQDTEEYPYVVFTVVVKLTPDEKDEPPSAMRVVGASRHFHYGPAAGDAGCFVEPPPSMKSIRLPHEGFPAGAGAGEAPGAELARLRAGVRAFQRVRWHDNWLAHAAPIFCALD